jgi:hypothetical protein
MDVVTTGNYAIVPDYYHGLRVLNIANPVNNIHEVGYYDTPGYPLAVAVVGNYTYIADVPYLGVYDCSAATSLIERVGNSIPSGFAIVENYPNPFNSTSMIKYQIAQTCNVELMVYDVTGKEIAKLVDFKQNPGEYQVQFDAKDLASGTYFVRLKAGDFKQTHKMVLLK